MSSPEEPSPGYARRWWVLATMTVCLLVVIMGNTILNVALPTLQRDLGATQAELQWAIDGYILVFAGLLFTWGVVGDRIGRRTVLLIGLTIFAVGSVFAAFSSSPIELIAWRAVMGVGGAAVQPTTLAVLTNVFPPQERGRAIGIWAGTAGIAVAGGPLAGGAVLQHFWWGSVFLVGVPVALLGIVGVLAVVPESKDPSPDASTCPASCCRSPPWPASSTGSSTAALGPDGRRRVCSSRCSAGWFSWPCSCGCSGVRHTRRSTSRCSATRPSPPRPAHWR
ncbi:MFS transporter [Blastococcus brunescens]|uniref:MFS transporter n=1 Tax=Blastococcus brunescens TaxID=1564165 RepID=UPI003BEEC190